MNLTLPLKVIPHPDGSGDLDYLLVDATHRLIAWSPNQECAQALVDLVNATKSETYSDN